MRRTVMYALIFDEHNLKKPSDEGYPGKPLRFSA
jgi:hypothetical protein